MKRMPYRPHKKKISSLCSLCLCGSLKFLPNLLLAAMTIALVLSLSACPKPGPIPGPVPVATRRHDPLTADDHARLGAVYERQGEKEAAVREYAAALSKDKKSLVALAGLGNLALAEDQPGLAIKYYRRALALEPENPVVLNNLAMAYIEAKKPKPALAYAEQAAQFGGEDDPRILDTRGQARILAGDRPAGMADLVKAKGLCDAACNPGPCDENTAQVCAELKSLLGKLAP
jgi:tetratricopeptide (TPR) repeat protein